MRIIVTLLICFFLISSNDSYSRPEEDNAGLLDSAALTGKKLCMTLGEALKEPASVYRLCLGGQQLGSLPADVGNLSKLQELNCSQNDLSELPSEFCKITNLQDLNLTANNLVALPACFTDLYNLKSLNLSSNTSMNWEPAFELLSRMTSLEILDLSYNDLADIPYQLARITTLKELNLSGNKFSEEEREKILNLFTKTNVIFED